MNSIPRHFCGWARSFPMVLFLPVLALGLMPSAHAAVVTACDEMSLRNAVAGGGSITFSCSGSITLTAGNGGPMTVAADTSVDGTGQQVTILGGSLVSLFVVPSGVTLKLNQLTLQGGFATGQGGGAIYNSGTLIISNCLLQGNVSEQGGGAIYNNAGQVTITGSRFLFNDGGFAVGAILNQSGTLVVTRTTFFFNNGSFCGTILNSGGRMRISESSIEDGNEFVAPFAISGGIANLSRYPVIIQKTVFLGNSSGALVNAGTMTITGSDFFGGQNILFLPAGIHNTGALTVADTTFSEVGGAGAILNTNTLTMTNSTIWQSNAFGRIAGYGLNNGGAATVTNSTFAANGNGIEGSAGTVILQNSIVGNNVTANCTASAGVVVDGGGNLDTDATCGVRTVSPSGLNLDTTLTFTGGSEPTVALLPGSAAIGNGILANCPIGDARGFPRPVASSCSSGSFEPGAVFQAFEAKLNVDSEARRFVVSGTFALQAGNSVDPASEVVQMRVGNFAIAIPSGSFRRDAEGFVFGQDEDEDRGFRMKISSLDGTHYSFRGEGRTPTRWTKANGPFIVQLSVGGNGGTAQPGATFGDPGGED